MAATAVAVVVMVVVRHVVAIDQVEVAIVADRRMDLARARVHVRNVATIEAVPEKATTAAIGIAAAVAATEMQKTDF
jgi:hypothetical protein